MAAGLNLPKGRNILIDVPLYKRALSFIIDYMVIDFFVITYFMGSIAQVLPLDKGVMETVGYVQKNPGIFGELTFMLGVLGVLLMAYFVYSQKVFGQTIGMRLMNIHLLNEDKKKESIDLWQVVLRNLFLIPLIPFILLAIADIIYLMIYNRKLSDKLARLRLVEEKEI